MYKCPKNICVCQKYIYKSDRIKYVNYTNHIIYNVYCKDICKKLKSDIFIDLEKKCYRYFSKK